jgi:putative hydrolase of the HAD superfamily
MQVLNISAFFDMSIRLILFDLGGVLYEIEHASTHAALRSLQSYSARPISFSLEQAEKVFGEYDAGRLDNSEFFSILRSEYSVDAQDQQIINAWNAMLLGLYPDTLTFIKKVSQQLPIALLSNINPIHHAFVQEECTELFSHFKHLFLSYELKLKKPEPEIFRYVIDQTGYSPKEILFLDDTPINCTIAESLGIQTQLINPHSREWITDLYYHFIG